MAASMLNFNVGILGHVDSGKTSLSKALSTTASTASFDKNPQSRERGITLDLGFSSFQTDAPQHLSEFEKVQYTLVDCPGHASLIKTIIGGAQIIDLMFLVVDVVKGIQTQTAECLVIGEITCKKMIVVLNKVDLLPVEKRAAMVEKMKKKMLKTLESTRFAGSPIISVAARPGGPEAVEATCEGLTELIELLKSHTYIPNRTSTGPLIFSVDHCFSIRGQGTVMTGTVLNGSVSVNDTVEIPSMKVTKKVKSMQMFRKPVDKIIQGDRAGVCVTQFDPKLLERGSICSPGALPTIVAGVIAVWKIPYYKGTVSSKAKFHITTGHDTVMGRLTFFGHYDNTDIDKNLDKLSLSDSGPSDFDFSKVYCYQDDLIAGKKTAANSADSTEKLPTQQFALVQFEKPVTCQDNCLVIGSRLDTDIHANVCRIAFHGKLVLGITDPNYTDNILPKIKVYKSKVKEGQVERVMDEYTVIAKNLFKKETNIAIFSGLKVKLSTGEDGVIEGSFGQSGKVKIRIPGGLPAETVKLYGGGKKKGKGKSGDSAADSEGAGAGPQEPLIISLAFKRYIYDTEKTIKQT